MGGKSRSLISWLAAIVAIVGVRAVAQDVPLVVDLGTTSQGRMQGHGVAVKVNDTHAITVAHNLRGARSILVAGRPATAERVDAANDYALLRVSLPGCRAASVATSPAAIGDRLHTSYAAGPVLRYSRWSDPAATAGLYTCGWPSRQGNSGSGVYDESGGLVGLVSASDLSRETEVVNLVPSAGAVNPTRNVCPQGHT